MQCADPQRNRLRDHSCTCVEARHALPPTGHHQLQQHKQQEQQPTTGQCHALCAAAAVIHQVAHTDTIERPCTAALYESCRVAGMHAVCSAQWAMYTGCAQAAEQRSEHTGAGEQAVHNQHKAHRMERATCACSVQCACWYHSGIWTLYCASAMTLRARPRKAS